MTQNKKDMKKLVITLLLTAIIIPTSSLTWINAMDTTNEYMVKV